MLAVPLFFGGGAAEVLGHELEDVVAAAGLVLLPAEVADGGGRGVPERGSSAVKWAGKRSRSFASAGPVTIAPGDKAASQASADMTRVVSCPLWRPSAARAKSATNSSPRSAPSTTENRSASTGARAAIAANVLTPITCAFVA